MNHTLREYVEGVPYGLAGAFFALLSVGAFAGGHIPLATAIALLGLSVLAFVAPFHALLIFIAVSPIAGPISALVAPDMDGQLLAELFLTVCLAGALFRFGLRKTSRRPLTTLEVISLLLIALVVTSALAGLGPEYVRLSNGEPPVSWTWHLLYRDYFGGSAALQPLYEGMPFIEGLLLFVVFGLSAGVRRAAGPAVRMLVLGAAAAAVFDIDKLLLVLARGEGLRQMTNLAIHVRISMSTGDVNAAGSYFAMALIPAISLLRSTPVAAVLLTGLISVGEALAGSRTAFAALALAGAGTGIYLAATARGVRRRTMLLGAVVVLAVAAIPSWHYLASRPTNASAGRAMEYRLGMWKKAVAMTRDHPALGIGIGAFAVNSPMYEPNEGIFSYPENAHNQFLQIMAELGILGLVGFLAIVIAALVHRYDNPFGLSMAVGLLAFLLSALGGHPLLIRTVAYAFWAALAIAAVGTPRAQAPRAFRITSWLAVIALAAAIPARSAGALATADFDHIGLGVSQWITDPSGDKYRIASNCASFYVPTQARRIEIAVRPHLDGEEALSVEFWEDGRLLNRIDLQGRQWTTTVFTGGLPDAHRRRFSPIELRVWRGSAAVPCGPAVLDVRKIVEEQ